MTTAIKVSNHNEHYLLRSSLFTWSDPESAIHRKARAFVPRPVAHTNYKREVLKVLKSDMGNPSEKTSLGMIVEVDKDKGFLVGTKEGSSWIHEVQMAGEKPITGLQFTIGQRSKEGLFCSNSIPINMLS